MSSIARANLRSHSKQYVAVSIAIIICCVFITISAAFGNLLLWVADSSGGAAYKGVSLVARESDNNESRENFSEAMEEFHKFAVATPQIVKNLGEGWQFTSQTSKKGFLTFDGKNLPLNVSPLPPEPFYQPVIGEGARPVEADTIVLSTDYFNQMGIKLGDEVTFNYKVWPSSDDTRRLSQEREEGKLTAKQYAELMEPKQHTLKARVVGQLSENTLMRMGNLPTAYLSPVSYAQISDMESAHLLFFATPQNLSVEQAQKELLTQMEKQGLQTKYIEITPPEKISKRQNKAVYETSIRAASLLFPALALLVCLLIVSVTFKVVLARRRREIALMRCVGATSKQVRRFTLLECVLVGIFSSLVGTALGVLCVLFLDWKFTLLGSIPQTLYVMGLFPLVSSILCGVLVTLFAGLRPTLGISRIKPIAALQPPELNVSYRRKRHIVRGVFTVIFLLLGIIAWAASRALQSAGLEAVKNPTGSSSGAYLALAILVAFIGSVLLFVAVLLLSLSFLPRFASLLTKPFKRVSPTMKMAGLNVMRDPHRVGATGMALVMGVTLITTMLIGTASLRTSVDKAVATLYPVDLVLSNSEHKAFTTGQQEAISQVKGVEKTLTLNTADLLVGKSIDGQFMSPTLISRAGHREDISYLSPELKKRAEDEQKAQDQAMATLNPFTTPTDEYAEAIDSYPLPIYIAPTVEAAKSIASGPLELPQGNEIWIPTENENDLERAKKDLGDHEWQLAFKGTHSWATVKLVPVLSIGLLANDGSSLLMSADLGAKLENMGAPITPSSLIARMDHNLSSFDLMQSINDILMTFTTQPSINGGITITTAINVLLSVISIILLCLIGVAVIVSFIGVFNTLSLSTVDRARENALLRALGFTRQQIRRMLFIEGSLIGIGALLIGLAASTLFAWFMVGSFPFEALGPNIHSHVTIPWLEISAVFICTLSGCMLAALLPGRRAAKASPVEALSDIR